VVPCARGSWGVARAEASVDLGKASSEATTSAPVRWSLLRSVGGMCLSSTIDVKESDEKLPIPLEWEVADETRLADDLLAWFVERVRDFRRRGVTPTERGSSEGIARVGLGFLEDREGDLDGEMLSGVWEEGLGLQDPEPWERRDCRDLVERAETSEE